MTAIVTHGILGWGNRKSGYEAYGPHGRWYTARASHDGNRSTTTGDLLGDHLRDVGATEGQRLIVVALPYGTTEEGAEGLEAAVTELMTQLVPS